MAPPCQSFPAKDLPSAVQTTPTGKLRKTDDGKRINLDRCDLMKLFQYECAIKHPDVPNSPIQCWPVQRLFRRCQDRNGKFMVETTAWEGTGTGTGAEDMTQSALPGLSRAGTDRRIQDP
ncbi:hypothetical protein QBC47DRAFT_385491 [Echria macrotheca]|uniref:Uncharacterized protein n=1 Tax=Echria macrotheca TaxID=438768 RepID=A0AAJ0B9A5_9PEZI|nr:hypothetical protein QBC47DRAFT_385491 [Echria macrotheca]